MNVIILNYFILNYIKIYIFNKNIYNIYFLNTSLIFSLFLFRLLAGLKHIIKLNEKKITMISIVMANEIEREQNLKSIGRKADWIVV